MTTKLASGIGGLLGGLAMMAFTKPRTILDATLRGGVSTGCGIIFSVPILTWLNLNTNNLDMQLMAGCVVGLFSWGILSMVAKFFVRAEKEDIDVVEAIKEIRGK